MAMLRVAGGFLVALGVLWALQGAGALDWPANSFMLGQEQWLRRGLVTAGIGAGLLALSRRRRRR